MKQSSDQLQQGFTLLELLIVFSIMVLLSAIGMASFVTYSHSQSVDTTMKEFKTMLFTARSRAISQLRDPTCFAPGFNPSNYVLTGYRVAICCPVNSSCSGITCADPKAKYELDAVYNNSNGNGFAYQTCETKQFSDPNVSFDFSSPTTATIITFDAISGAVSTNVSAGQAIQVGITGYGITKLATVSATGVIQ